jgi:DUF4097 and DUF4098 domain-containing protein YvlB
MGVQERLMEHVRTVAREFETGEHAVLHVEARSGAVVVESHEAPRVTVEATVRTWTEHSSEADAAAALVEAAIEQDAHRVIVRAPTLPKTDHWSWFAGSRGSRVDYAIRVPVDSAVRVLSRSGSVRVTGTHGRLHIESGSGRVSVEHVAGDVTVLSRSGSVAVERIHGTLTAEARSGRIDVRAVSGETAVEARSGSIEVREIGGELRVKTHTGSINMHDVAGDVKAQAHTGAVRYTGKVLGDYDVRAHTGMIHLAVDPDYPFYIDAESEIGSVRSDLPPRRGAGPASGDGPKVRLRTRTGSIRITRA